MNMPYRSFLRHRRVSLKSLFAVMLLIATLPAMAIQPLVQPEWLLSSKNAKDVVILDIQNEKSYAKFHIPGAVNAPYSRWRTAPPAKPSGNLPPVDKLEKLIGGLGISNDDTVLIVATGQGASDMAASARVYWTFRVLGHEAVGVLDGGLFGYYQATGQKGPLSSGVETRPAATFKADYQPQFVATADSVKKALKSGSELVDARSRGEFVGVLTGGKKERGGTVPGSHNLPHDWLTVNRSARLHSNENLKSLFEATEVPLDGEQIHYCHSGNRAALTWFVAHAVFGNEKASLYDASMKEWAPNPDLPIEAQINLCTEC